jgi:Glycosyl transferase family 2
VTESQWTEARRYLPNRLVNLLNRSQREQLATARRSISVQGLPRHRFVRGSIWGITLARNEADVIATTIRHHLDQGFDGVIAVDNSSEDGTPDILRQTAQDPRVFVGTDSHRAHIHGAKMTHLAVLAARAGADWVVPFDADEHWYAQGMTVASLLRSLPAAMVDAPSHTVVPSPHGGRLAFVSNQPARVTYEADPGWTKVAFRVRRRPLVGDGNHHVYGVYGPRVSGLNVLHYPYRSFEQFRAKVRAGAAAIRATNLSASACAHWRELDALDEDELTQVWSDYLRDGGGIPGQTLLGLTDVVSPWETWTTWDPDGILGA